MTEPQLEAQIRELAAVVSSLGEIRSRVEAQRNSLIEQNHAEFEAAYNMVLRSIGEAAVTADAISAASRDAFSNA